MYCFEDFHPKVNSYIRKLIDNNNITVVQCSASVVQECKWSQYLKIYQCSFHSSGKKIISGVIPCATDISERCAIMKWHHAVLCGSHYYIFDQATHPGPRRSIHGSFILFDFHLVDLCHQEWSQVSCWLLLMPAWGHCFLE